MTDPGSRSIGIALVEAIAANTGAESRGRCRGCEGRGWRVATAIGRMRLEEVGASLARRPCPDCVDGLVSGAGGRLVVR
jgi:hypothetical protein